MTAHSPIQPEQSQALSGFVRIYLEELDGPALDWAVAQAAGINVQIESPQYQNLARAYRVTSRGLSPFRPSTEWADAGPLMREYQVALNPEAHNGAEGTETSERWIANIYYSGGDQYTTEPARNELVALCRAVAVTKFGDWVSVPVELSMAPEPAYPRTDAAEL
ncbi:MAG: phage protein NinX family protein (plasmid) [Pseudomonas rhizophila]|uniref:phage protein NinX family protein n=1 Tax=Pseudomonas rhizophila TaxID=2045200 RepID=UPI003F6B8C47